MHTPGPWTFDGGWRVWGEPRRLIADVHFRGEPRTPAGADDLANARLIAAAPDLLAALESIMQGQLGGSIDTDAERFVAARAAIAKAKGGAA